MKKLFLSLAISGIVAASAVAQEQKETTPTPVQKPAAQEQKDTKDAKQVTDQKKPAQDRAAWEKKFKEELKLTEDQVQKYDALNKEYNEKIEAVAKDASLSADAQKEKKTGLKKEKEAKLWEILTPEQQAKYKEMKESMQKKETPKQGS